MAQHAPFDDLVSDLQGGRLDRREFVLRAAALGATVPVIAAILAACGGTATPTTAPVASAAPASAAASTAPASASAASAAPAASAAASAAAATSARPSAAASAATGASAAPAASASAAPSGTAGGTLKLALPQNVDLNPIGVRTVGAFYLQSSIYDGLLTSSANWDAVEPALAEKWTVSSDGLTYTFNLRKGVNWHDGQAFTAKDVEFTYKLFLNKAVGSYFSKNLLTIKGAQDFYDGKSQTVEGLKVVDDNTFSITLTKPSAAFAFSTLTQHSIVPMHVWKDVSADDLTKPATWEKNQVGTGPFKFSSYQADKFLELVRHDTAWRGKPLLDKILFVRVGTTPEAIAAALEKGDIDYAQIPSTEIDRMSKISTLVVKPKAVYNIRAFGVNVDKPAFKDKRVRQALAYGIDRAGLAESVLAGVSTVANSFSPSAKWNNPNLPKYEYSMDKAKALLKDAGWDANLEFDLALYYNDQGHKDYIAAAQQQLAKIGMKAKVVQLDGSAVQSYYYTDRKFDVMLGGYGISPDMDEYSGIFTSTAKWPAGQNAMLYANPRVDELFQQGSATTDDTQRKKIYDEVQAILMEELPWIPCYFLKIAGGFNKRVQNGDAINNVWNRPYNWSIEKVSVSDGK
ncbi:MAG: ABC transporter substrate-binding protein [Thermomicrobiales bacterium]